MNPQSPFTGHEQQPTPGHGLPPVVNPPVPPAGVPEQLPQSQRPEVAGQDTSAEQWMGRVEEALSAPNPQQRADSFANLKAHYQQEVLGLNVRAKAE